MMSWRDEMSQMLTAFEYQAKSSLGNIKQDLKRNGLAPNADFKQYFLRVSYDRIKNVYDEFEISLMFEDANTSATDEYPNLFHTPRYAMNNSQQTTNDPFEIIDSSDEEDQPSKMERAIRYNGHGISHELKDYVQFDDNRSYTEMSDMKSNVFDYQGDVSQNRDWGWIEMNNAIKAKEMELNDGIPIVAIDVHRAMNITSQNTSTEILSNASSNGGGAKRNNMAGKSFGHQRKHAESSSTSKSLQNKKSTPSNPMETKRFQCEVCEYSSNRKWCLNVHSRTHTGEKPYRCNICQKEFTQPNNLKQHKVTHTKEFSFHCRGCFSGFSQKAEIDAHEKLCKERSYECYICKKYVTVDITHLKIHMRTHSGEKPFRCEICMVSFTAKSSLKTHLDIIHTRINP